MTVIGIVFVIVDVFLVIHVLIRWAGNFASTLEQTVKNIRKLKEVF